MSLIVFLIVLAIQGLIFGALARLALPGKDPMSIPMTIGLGIAGSFIGGLLTYAISGGRNAGGFFVAFLCTVGVVAVMHEPGAHRAVRGEPEVALELPRVVVAVPDRDLALGEHRRHRGGV